MSDGQTNEEHFRRAAVYIDKIVQGAKPADLRVEQPTTIDLAITRKTARAIALAIPKTSLSARTSSSNRALAV